MPRGAPTPPRSRKGHRPTTYSVKIGNLSLGHSTPAAKTKTTGQASTPPPSIKEVSYKVTKAYNKTSAGLGSRLSIPTRKKKKKKGK